MGSMVAVKGILSIMAEARAETQRIINMATTRDPPEIFLTWSAMICINPVSSAPATTIKSIMKKISVGHSISFSSISTISTRLITIKRAAPIRAATLGSMCKAPWMINRKMVIAIIRQQ